MILYPFLVLTFKDLIASLELSGFFVKIPIQSPGNTFSLDQLISIFLCVVEFANDDIVNQTLAKCF